MHDIRSALLFYIGLKSRCNNPAVVVELLLETAIIPAVQLAPQNSHASHVFPAQCAGQEDGSERGADDARDRGSFDLTIVCASARELSEETDHQGLQGKRRGHREDTDLVTKSLQGDALVILEDR